MKNIIFKGFYIAASCIVLLACEKEDSLNRRLLPMRWIHKKRSLIPSILKSSWPIVMPTCLAGWKYCPMACISA